jgi:hypothetical protein
MTLDRPPNAGADHGMIQVSGQDGNSRDESKVPDYTATVTEVSVRVTGR